MISDKETMIIAILFVLVILRFYMYSIRKQSKKDSKEILSTSGCPGNGTGKLHIWKYDLEEGGHICTICNKKPGFVE
jgi:hypothetical protein